MNICKVFAGVDGIECFAIDMITSVSLSLKYLINENLFNNIA